MVDERFVCVFVYVRVCVYNIWFTAVENKLYYKLFSTPGLNLFESLMFTVVCWMVNSLVAFDPVDDASPSVDRITKLVDYVEHWTEEDPSDLKKILFGQWWLHSFLYRYHNSFCKFSFRDRYTLPDQTLSFRKTIRTVFGLGCKNRN